MTAIQTWLQPRLDFAASRHPKLIAFWSLLLRHRYLIIGITTFILAIKDGQGGLVTFDSKLFTATGMKLLSADWADTFSDSSVQEGPPLILIYGLLTTLADLTGIDVKFFLSVFTQVPFTLLLMYTVRRLMRVADAESPGLEAYVGAFALAGFLSWSAFGSGHLAEGFLPLMWIGAAIASRDSRPVAAGLLLGLAASLKIWGILGVPVLLFSPRLRDAVKAGLVSAGTLAAVWAPFFIFGTVRTFQYEWTVQVTSFARHAYDIGAPVTWAMRAHQGAVAMATGVVCFLVTRKRMASLWLVPFAIIAMRLVLDPTIYYYYTLPLSILGLIGAAVIFPALHPFVRLPIVAATYMALHPFYVLEERMLALSGLIATVVLIGSSPLLPPLSPASGPSGPSPRSRQRPTSTP